MTYRGCISQHLTVVYSSVLLSVLFSASLHCKLELQLTLIWWLRETKMLFEMSHQTEHICSGNILYCLGCTLPSVQCTLYSLQDTFSVVTLGNIIHIVLYTALHYTK